MAYNESEVPENVRDILAYMPPDLRARVLADYESHYAPFLGMLAGWKGAVQSHFAYGEDSAIARLQEQFFPLGEWKFPAQTLAVPSRAPERTVEILAESEFDDPAGRPWLASGLGWVHPTQAQQDKIEQIDNDWYVSLDVGYLGDGTIEEVLAKGQLAFVAGTEELVAALEKGEWWVVLPRSEPRPVAMQRYDGYMNFEREIATARLNQRHLDLWLPPCYPYSRKMVRFHLGTGRPRSGETPDLSWFGSVPGGFKLIGILRHLDRRAVSALRVQQRMNGSLFYLNAVPVVQTAVQMNVFYPPFPRYGTEYGLRVTGESDVYAAVVYNDAVTVPATMYRLPSAEPDAKEMDVEARFLQTESRTATVKIYFGSSGQERGDNDRPSLLELTPLRFQIPFRSMGGATVSAAADRSEWARTAWYHSVLRPPLLTEGDITELFRQRKSALGEILQFGYATREILHEPDEGNVHWRSYLWPSLIPKEDNFDARYGEIPASNYIPLVQNLRLAFRRGPAAAGLQEFLQADVANYLASVLTQYFVFSTFRVEGRVV